MQIEQHSAASAYAPLTPKSLPNTAQLNPSSPPEPCPSPQQQTCTDPTLKRTRERAQPLPLCATLVVKPSTLIGALH